VCRHGSQTQGGAQADAVEGHLIDTVFHRGNAVRRRVPGVFTLSASCFTSIFSQLARHHGLQRYKAMAVSSKLS
jgi:hypothetical protein